MTRITRVAALLAFVVAQLTMSQETEVAARQPLRLDKHSSGKQQNHTLDIVSWESAWTATTATIHIHPLARERQPLY